MEVLAPFRSLYYNYIYTVTSCSTEGLTATHAAVFRLFVVPLN